MVQTHFVTSSLGERLFSEINLFELEQENSQFQETMDSQEEDYYLAVEMSMQREQMHQRRREEAATTTQNIFSVFNSLTSLEQLPEGAGNETPRVYQHRLEAQAPYRPPSNNFLSLVKGIFFGIGSLFIYSHNDKMAKVIRYKNKLQNNKELWENVLYSFFQPNYNNQVHSLFLKAQEYLEKKEKSIKTNYYLKITLLSTALFTGFAITLRARLFFQVTATIACLTSLVFLIYKSGQAYYDEARLAINLKSRTRETSERLYQNLLSIEVISDKFDN